MVMKYNNMSRFLQLIEEVVMRKGKGDAMEI